MGAVGPTQYVVFVNGRLVTFNKTTGVADGVLNADPDVFFASVTQRLASTSDPRIRYDRLTGRWFLVIINVSTPNRILFAVSDAASDGTITGGTVWTFFFITIATHAAGDLQHLPRRLPDARRRRQRAVHRHQQLLRFAGQTFNSTDGYVVRKSSILGAGPIVVTVFRGLVANAAAVGPVHARRASTTSTRPSTEGYFIGVDNATFGTAADAPRREPGRHADDLGEHPDHRAAPRTPLAERAAPGQHGRHQRPPRRARRPPVRGAHPQRPAVDRAQHRREQHRRGVAAR